MYSAFHARQPIMNYIKMETGKQIYGVYIVDFYFRYV